MLRAAETKQGRWTREEQLRYIEGLRLYGKDWKSIALFVGTRTARQVKSHDQKFRILVAKISFNHTDTQVRRATSSFDSLSSIPPPLTCRADCQSSLVVADTSKDLTSPPTQLQDLDEMLKAALQE
jgi:SHAQKYF class myb-like DNA-binding protein